MVKSNFGSLPVALALERPGELQVDRTVEALGAVGVDRDRDVERAALDRRRGAEGLVEHLRRVLAAAAAAAAGGEQHDRGDQGEGDGKQAKPGAHEGGSSQMQGGRQGGRAVVITCELAGRRWPERTIGRVRLIHSACLLLALLVIGPAAGIGGSGHRARRAGPHARPRRSVPDGERPAAAARPCRQAHRAGRAGPSVRSVLRRLRDAGEIGADEYAERIASYAAALRSRDGLFGTRRRELQSVINTTDFFAAAGRLTASRLPAVFLTLDRNREWWTSGTLLRSGDRISFRGSRLIFQYYPGEGVQLQMLANFGRANGLWEGGYDESLGALLDELLPLAARRAGGIAWEYYFYFGGGRPPWASAMAQGTAIQALSRAAARLQEPAYLDVARQALPIFSVDAPTGVRVRIRGGRPLRALLLRARIPRAQRVPPVARRALRHGDARRERHGAAAVRARGPRGPARAARLRHRRLVDVRPGQRVRPQLPPARDRVPRQPVPPHRHPALLRDGRELHALRARAAPARAAHDPRRPRRGRAHLVPRLEDLAGGHDRRARRTGVPLHQRDGVAGQPLVRVAVAGGGGPRDGRA